MPSKPLNQPAQKFMYIEMTIRFPSQTANCNLVSSFPSVALRPNKYDTTFSELRYEVKLFMHPLGSVITLNRLNVVTYAISAPAFFL